MTNFERLMALDDDVLHVILCKLFDGRKCEEKCPAVKYCCSGHNGMIDWLRAERKEQWAK